MAIKMTYRELYLQAKSQLAAAGVDSPGFDAAVLAEHFLGLDRPALALRGGESPPPRAEEAFLQGLSERVARRPLQYITGQWPFMGLNLKVGEGVLVPREDTAVLVERLAERLAGIPSPHGLDLCAGTGAVALGLCSLIPGAQVTCVEAAPAAFAFLRENLAQYRQFHVTPVLGDVLAGPADSAQERGAQELDFIASNPPYIAAGELPGLQPEVRREPELALNGGPDGLVFYRAILENWAPLLRTGGVLAVEIGDAQGPAVEALFCAAGLGEVQVCQDLAGLDRVVIGTKKNLYS